MAAENQFFDIRGGFLEFLYSNLTSSHGVQVLFLNVFVAALILLGKQHAALMYIKVAAIM